MFLLVCELDSGKVQFTGDGANRVPGMGPVVAVPAARPAPGAEC